MTRYVQQTAFMRPPDMRDSTPLARLNTNTEPSNTC